MRFVRAERFEVQTLSSNLELLRLKRSVLTVCTKRQGGRRWQESRRADKVDAIRFLALFQSLFAQDFPLRITDATELTTKNFLASPAESASKHPKKSANSLD